MQMVVRYCTFLKLERRNNVRVEREAPPNMVEINRYSQKSASILSITGFRTMHTFSPGKVALAFIRNTNRVGEIACTTSLVNTYPRTLRP